MSGLFIGVTALAEGKKKKKSMPGVKQQATVNSSFKTMAKQNCFCELSCVILDLELLQTSVNATPGGSAVDAQVLACMHACKREKREKKKMSQHVHKQTLNRCLV